VRVLVISNDVIPGFGVPVAAPGLRAAGIAAGLRSHGFDVDITVPVGVIEQLFPGGAPPAPETVSIVDPRELVSFISDGGYTAVVFSNANMTPHLQPVAGVLFVFDLFAPKLLEALASPAGGRPWQEMVAEKERGMALADMVWVNGRRKLGYALGWLLRTSVEQYRKEMGLASLVDAGLIERITLVEMPVPLPEGLSHVPPDRAGQEPIRLGVAGYAQAWSSLDAVHPAHRQLVDAGHELHALVPPHWGGPASATPTNHLPPSTIAHGGPLRYTPFGQWIQSMDAMVDVFTPSAERRFAMITRSAVSLRLGVPLLHGVDSEVADIIRAYDAGWVLDADDEDAWRRAAQEVADPVQLARKRAGAQQASIERFAPSRALADAAKALREAHER